MKIKKNNKYKEQTMHTKILTVLIILSATFVILAACSKGTESTPGSVPVLTTTAVTNITATTAVSGGNITSDGGSAVTARGVCWGTNTTPTIADNRTTDGTGTGSYVSIITGLTANTTYYVRAYATNSVGTGYGSIRTFYASTSNSLEYLGETPPGRVLKQFAPGIISPDVLHGTVTVSADGQEIYFTSLTAIKITKLEDGHWTSPQTISFSGQGTSTFYDDVPVVSPDNKRLFFLSQRPTGYVSPNRENIWYVDRTATGWSEPKPLPQIVNSTPGIHWQVSVANNGNLYFGAISDLMRLYVTRYINGEYTVPEALSSLNNFGQLTCPFIAPDESYIIYCKVVDGIGSLFISFKSSNGQWQSPQQMEGLGNRIESSFVSRDRKYLFTGAMWISAEIIEDLRPRN